MRRVPDPMPELCVHVQCLREARSLKLCTTHYKRMITGRSIAPAVPPRRRQTGPLTIDVIEEELGFGISIPELAQVYGIDPESVRAAIRRHRREAA